MTLRTISYGGGVQSSALIVLAAQGKLKDIIGGDLTAALFSNVGDDSEHPKTLDYVRNIMIPWSIENDVNVLELRKVDKYGNEITLLEKISDPDKKFLKIPARYPSGAPASRHCTVDWKVRVLQKWLRENGATQDDPAIVSIGISTDEYQRANSKSDAKYEKRIFPLLELGLSRDDCINLIADAGLEVPPKSSCYFCPFHTVKMWQDMRDNEPELFEKAAQLEDILHMKSEKFGFKKLYLSRRVKPLREAFPEKEKNEEENFNDGECDSGFCWT